jgi:hypothetical protein
MLALLKILLFIGDRWKGSCGQLLEQTNHVLVLPQRDLKTLFYFIPVPPNSNGYGIDHINNRSCGLITVGKKSLQLCYKINMFVYKVRLTFSIIIFQNAPVISHNKVGPTIKSVKELP